MSKGLASIWRGKTDRIHTFQQEEELFTAQFTRNGGLKSKRWIRLEEAFVLSCGIKQKGTFFLKPANVQQI